MTDISPEGGAGTTNSLQRNDLFARLLESRETQATSTPEGGSR